MKYRVLGTVALAAAIAFARPVSYLAQESGKAVEILALARKAIGAGKIDSLKTFAVDAAVQRNVAAMQINSDVEIYVELPDKYARVENTSGGPGMVIAGGGVSGFNGERSLQKVNAGGMPGGMVIRMGGAGSFPGSNGAEKPTPEQIEQMKKASLRSARTEVSRLMLGWLAMAHPAAQATYSYTGEAESVEGKAYVIDVRNTDGFAARLFIDEQTSLPLMVTYQAAQPRVMTQSMSAPGGHGTVSNTAVSTADVQKQIQDLQNQPPQMADYTLYFEDWRSVDGVKFPFKMRRATGGNTTEEWTVSKVRVNPKIDAKKFAVDDSQ
jgi:hypothetical protein